MVGTRDRHDQPQGSVAEGTDEERVVEQSREVVQPDEGRDRPSPFHFQVLIWIDWIKGSTTKMA